MPRVARYIYAMQRVRKAHQDKVILDEVTLAFLPGAKIGVVGPNGAGKSTVLEVMAGLQTVSNGEAALAPGATVGILLQEPRLDPAKDVLGNVEEGVAATRALLRRFEELGQRLGEAGPEQMERLLDELSSLADGDLTVQATVTGPVKSFAPPAADERQVARRAAIHQHRCGSADRVPRRR